MTRPSPEEHVIQKARVWRRADKAHLGAQGGAKARTAKELRLAERKLREAADMLEQKSGAN